MIVDGGRDPGRRRVEERLVVTEERTRRAGAGGGRGVRRTLVRTGVAGLVTATAVVAAPGTALAAGTIAPLLDCWSVSGTTTTLVLGYSNTKSKAATYDVGGSSNHWTPARYDGPQPDTFEVGTFHGVFRVVMASADVPTATWTLGSTTLDVGDAKAATAGCPTGTPLPASGNGTGAAVALLAAGGIGALLVRRARRRVTA
ncbi:hypothetical protein KUM42_05995 [Modestobacter sp. L9-4]|uniref:hypothetical protein n=1 Tax=Modestobacter sp. L9-4 TaxID=2851567 RepID=UPI001C79A3AD|nr:hypothetical protein [Modestobacter sp. L9-4]QXG77076.1 hypothetical protein KUM42_05995 [Modestobacter sp. L9-4]